MSRRIQTSPWSPGALGAAHVSIGLRWESVLAELLWQPSPARAKRTQIYRFLEFVSKRHELALDDYESLYTWSVENVASFWAAVWDFCGVIHSRGYEQVVDDPRRMPGATWFSGARLNFAENLLRYRDERSALVFRGEDQPVTRLSYAELYRQVGRLARELRAGGVGVGDRVVGFMPNMPETVIAMLAATSLGAIWSSCSPDFGRDGVLDRFGQIEPKVLFSADGYHYNGRCHDSLGTVAEVCASLPSLEQIVIVPYLERRPELAPLSDTVLFEEFLGVDTPSDLEFEQLPFDHPVYIMYSSGTTGVPKCIVHGAGGTLIQHLKELMLHTDLGREDRIVYFTTCGWMMWNWLVSSLATGATLVLYDGSPFYPDGNALFELAEREEVSVFGTSAKFLAAAEKAGIRPVQRQAMSASHRSREAPTSSLALP
jgi:acetoacetyl-CoA synthetase